MKKILYAFIVSMCIFGSAANAQIPVTDGLHIGFQKAEFLVQIENWKKQVDQLKTQINAITGARGLGFSNYSYNIREFLPPGYQAQYDAITQNGYYGMTAAAKLLRDRTRVYDCANIASKVGLQSYKACDTESNKISQDKAFILDAVQKSRTRLSQIESLMGSINGTSEQKAILEIQGRIQVEQAALQNETMNVALYQKLSEVETQLAKQRVKEQWTSTMNTPVNINFQPINFN